MFTLVQKLLPKHLLSRLVGYLATCEIVVIKTLFINLFCLFYRVNMNEAQRTNKNDYQNFNDFFTRPLKEGLRPIHGRFSSPADGTVAALGNIKDNTLIQSKKHSYSVQELLADDTDDFANGSFITIYLAPHNYHRVHTPCAAELQRAAYIPGELFSVNQSTAENLPNLFARNERLVCRFDTDDGAMAQVLVGAMLVAGIKPVWLDSIYEPRLTATDNMQQSYKQGEELAQFQMGSTVILLFKTPLTFAFKQGDPIKVGQALTG